MMQVRHRVTILAGLALVCGPAMAQSPLPAIAEPVVNASLIAPALRVSSAEPVVKFYQTVLGMKVLATRDTGSVLETMLAFANNPERPAIILLSPSGKPAASDFQTGGSKLIIRVEDLEAVAKRMDVAGLVHEPLRQSAFKAKVLTITDPEKNQLELVQTVPTSERRP
jgi:predicted enzyme related to lactoylglutathione lyase